MARSRHLPNIITVARIAVSPAIFFLALSSNVSALMAAFVLFVAAALSDLWDGYLARKHGLITDVGKLLDPLADKLLLACTFIPFYVVSHRPGTDGLIPWWGQLPLWVVVIVFGREVAVTVLRWVAARRGVVIAAGKSGKYKAFVQNLFVGGLLLWYPLVRLATRGDWGGGVWGAWSLFHTSFIGVTLAVAILLTVYSMGVYFWQNRSLPEART